ncbi:hypothetical protein LCGC14_3087950 [marine sediment metagenome]|uniref:Uncharacterized protein n=1 Tax=marine sediment metagenome TaxID=412755 RepID=A0A0F8Z1V6_9ZZZZ
MNKEPMNNNAYFEEFEEFWKEYPNKTGKRAAYAKWNATLKKNFDAWDEWTPESMLTVAAIRYATATEKTEAKYIKHAATFLGPDEYWREMLEQAEV